PAIDPSRRVLGVIRPTVESIGAITQSKHIGVLATVGTIKSESYPLEIYKLFPDIQVSSEACPMWVSLVENNETYSQGVDYFIQRHVDNLLHKDPQIDTIILGCTHYPLLIHTIMQYVPEGIRVVSQGEYVAISLKEYLYRHPEMNEKCTRGGNCVFYTTEAEEKFSESASVFLNSGVDVHKMTLG
ncbi:Glutamate racemase, partial [termite gut metagenome]